MVSHLLHDVEIFWLRAVLGADESAIDRLRDGWTAPPLPGPELRAAYRRETASALEARPGPPPGFDAPRLERAGGRARLGETSLHAGHPTAATTAGRTVVG